MDVSSVEEFIVESDEVCCLLLVLRVHSNFSLCLKP